MYGLVTTAFGARLAPAEGAPTRVPAVPAAVTMVNVLPDFFAESPGGPPAEAVAAKVGFASVTVSVA